MTAWLIVGWSLFAVTAFILYCVFSVAAQTEEEKLAAERRRWEAEEYQRQLRLIREAVLEELETDPPLREAMVLRDVLRHTAAGGGNA